ncbi:MAG: hypothetical protein JWN44_5900 [Myxococcales bacterium]|nr:hypothetical protein [Myxococcales bacterium]
MRAASTGDAAGVVAPPARLLLDADELPGNGADEPHPRYHTRAWSPCSTS